MSLKIALLLIALACVSGIGIGYFLRLIITLGKRGSMELLVRKMTLDAESKAKNRADERAREILNEFKEKERELKQTEERLVRKEELLDKSQTNLDSEQETISKKNEEIQKTKEDVEKTIRAEREKLEKIEHLSEE